MKEDQKHRSGGDFRVVRVNYHHWQCHHLIECIRLLPFHINYVFMLYNLQIILLHIYLSSSVGMT